MTTRYSLPQHLSTDDHDRAAGGRTIAALVLVIGVIALSLFVAVLPAPESTLAAGPEQPAAEPLPGA